MPYGGNIFVEKEECISHIINVWTVVSEKYFLGKEVCFALVFNSTQNDLSKKEPY